MRSVVCARGNWLGAREVPGRRVMRSETKLRGAGQGPPEPSGTARPSPLATMVIVPRVL